MRKKIAKIIRKHNTNIILKGIVDILLFVGIILYLNKHNNLKFETIFDTTAIISATGVIFIDLLATFVTNFVLAITEDSFKLSEEYHEIAKRYIDNTIEYRNDRDEKVNNIHSKFKIKNNYNEDVSPKDISNKLPEIELAFRKESDPYFSFEFIPQIVDNEIKHYEIENFIIGHTKDLFSAHKYSYKENKLLYRLDNLENFDKDITRKNGCKKIHIEYELTSFYNSLLTNRAADFDFFNGVSLRELYAPGPIFPSYKQSKFSNHIGLTGFVELKDGEIIFVKQKANNSIGKRKWVQSIGYALKVEDIISDSGCKRYELNEERLSRAIIKIVNEKLGIDICENSNGNLFSKSVFAIYADLVECGKPQFAFYIKLEKISKEAFEQCYFNKKVCQLIKKLNEKVHTNFYKYDAVCRVIKSIIKVRMKKDIKYIKIQDLKDSNIGIASIKIEGKEFNMMPASIAGIVLLKKHLKNK